MMSCTEEIEPLGDEELERKQAKAEKYANAPERFTLFFTEIGVEAEDGNALVMYSDDGDWSCTCDFFEVQRTCEHVMAVGRVLKHLPVVQPRGNVQDT